MRSFAIVLATVAAAAALIGQAAALPAPLMPTPFTVNFTEVIDKGQPTVYHQEGVWHYDIGNNRERMDRVDGSRDAVCSSVRKEVTACTQLMVKDNRYVFFPELNGNPCCIIGTAADGFGPLAQNWLQNDQAIYLGNQTIDGNKCSGWIASAGPHDDEYWNTQEGAVPARTSDGPMAIQTMKVDTYITRVDAAVFDIPEYCANAKSCSSSRF